MQYSVIVFDTAPTGHTLRFLSFPTVLEKALGKISQLGGRFGPMIQQVSAGFCFGLHRSQFFLVLFWANSGGTGRDSAWGSGGVSGLDLLWATLRDLICSLCFPNGCRYRIDEVALRGSV